MQLPVIVIVPFIPVSSRGPHRVDRRRGERRARIAEPRRADTIAPIRTGADAERLAKLVRMLAVE